MAATKTITKNITTTMTKNIATNMAIFRLVFWNNLSKKSPKTNLTSLKRLENQLSSKVNFSTFFQVNSCNFRLKLRESP